MKKRKLITSFVFLVFILFPDYSLQAMIENTISINTNDLIDIDYSDENLILHFKKNCWEKMRTFTTINIGKQVIFEIDSEVLAKPHVSHPCDSQCQIYVNEREAKKIINKFKSDAKNKITYSQVERVEFLENWLDKNPYDSIAFNDILNLYHANEKRSDCQKAIDFYEKFPSVETKEQSLKTSIFQIVDCYVDLNLNRKGIILLQSSIGKINSEDTWKVYDYLAYLHENESKYKAAINYYKNALSALGELELQIRDDYVELGLVGFSDISNIINEDRDRIQRRIDTLEFQHLSE